MNSRRRRTTLVPTYMHFVRFLVLALISFPAWAGTASLTWAIPTTRTDGTALPSSQYAGTLIEYGTCATLNPLTFGTKMGEFFVAGTATTHTFTLTPLMYCFRAAARDTASLQSAFTNPVNKDVQDAPPSSPSNLTVVAQTVFTIIKQTDRFVLLPVGTVPANTPCDSTQSVNGHYAVPRSAVTWAGTVRPAVVVAACG